jgi:hypothetical protein
MLQEEKIETNTRMLTPTNSGRFRINASTEQAVVGVIIAQAAAKNPLTRRRLKTYVKQLTGVSVGRTWLRDFLKRWSHVLHPSKGTVIAPKRQNTTKVEEMEYFTTALERQRAAPSIP